MAQVTGVSFHPHSTRLASISDDGALKLWDVSTGQEALTLRPAAGGGSTFSVRFSPDGDMLAVARRRHVTLWDAGDRTGDSQSHSRDKLHWARTWHENQAVESARSRNRFAQIFHLSQLIALAPDEPTYYFRRGNAYALWSRYEGANLAHIMQALADFYRAAELVGRWLWRQPRILLPLIHFPVNGLMQQVIEGLELKHFTRRSSASRE